MWRHIGGQDDDGSGDRRRRSRDQAVRRSAARARRSGECRMTSSAAASRKAAITAEVLDLVPELRADFERRDLGAESVVWSALAPTPTALDPVATVMLDVIDGSTSIGDLADGCPCGGGCPACRRPAPGRRSRRAVPRRRVCSPGRLRRSLQNEAIESPSTVRPGPSTPCAGAREPPRHRGTPTFCFGTQTGPRRVRLPARCAQAAATRWPDHEIEMGR